jgi:hypothetical protein
MIGAKRQRAVNYISILTHHVGKAAALALGRGGGSSITSGG